MSTLAEALEAAADLLGDGMTAHHVGGHFTCIEAEVIADLLVAAGYPQAAETWLDGHAEGDDDPDDLPDHLARQQRNRT